MVEQLQQEQLDQIMSLIESNIHMFKYFPFIKNDFLIVLRNDKAESLLYLFPLIERIIVEILSLEPNSDIEHYSQGTYRTMNEILNKNKDILTELLGYEIYQSLCYLYIDNNNNKSLRNQICHIKQPLGYQVML